MDDHKKSKPKEQKNVLILDDDPTDCYLLRRLLDNLPRYKMTFFIAHDIKEAEKVFRGIDIDVIFVDYSLGATIGTDFIKATGGRALGVPVVTVSGIATAEIRQEAFKAGASSFISKINLNADIVETALEIAEYTSKIENQLRNSASRNDIEKNRSQSQLLELITMTRMVMQKFQGEQGNGELARHSPEILEMIREIKECCEIFEVPSEKPIPKH